MSTNRYVDVNRSLDQLENRVSPGNHDDIVEFINHQAAEGISEIQQQRQIYSLRLLLTEFTSSDFRLKDATEAELKDAIASLNRSDYADATTHKIKGMIKKFYKVLNGGHEHPDKIKFLKTTLKQPSPVTRRDLFTKEELKRLFNSFTSTRDRAFTMTLYESAARPGELLEANICDFTSTGKGDFIFLAGKKNTPDRTNQLVRAGRPIREWLAQHPHGGELGDFDDPDAPLWVKTEQQNCRNCGEPYYGHDDHCKYEPDTADRYSYQAFRQRFKAACEKAEIPENKCRPYNLRHTRITEVATFMGYEQLNKFAGWKPGSDRAKVYVHLNNDDVNRAIRDQYGLTNDDDESKTMACPFCSEQNQTTHSECRNCGRPLSLEQTKQQQEKLQVLERLAELEEQGVLEKLDQLKDL